MEKGKSSIVLLLLLLSAFLVLGWITNEKELSMQAKQNTIVLLKFKAQAGKGKQAVAELTKLIEQVQGEPHFVSIKLHVDPNDNTNILLYEEWEDANYYNGAHMNTPYMKAFQANSVNFLGGPPEITFWKVENTFE